VFRDEDHPSFPNRPHDDETVWRYMDLFRYLSLLQSSSLHFARADQMRDNWEGSYGQLNIVRRPEIYGDSYEERTELENERREWHLLSAYLNCWHLSDIESAAMWDIYQREGRGVAVRSTWGRLKSSLTTEGWVRGGKVSYVDYQSVFIDENNAFTPFMHKRESFRHEQEVRLLHLRGYNNEHFRSTGRGEARDEPGPPVLALDVDISVLIESVYVAPDAPEWVHGVVSDVTAQYGHTYPVRQSDLARDPIL